MEANELKTEQICNVQSGENRNLIHNDISRCNDYRCPLRAFCSRFRQLRFDKENGNTQMSVTDFKGRDRNGLCDHFINADIHEDINNIF